jgi:hypothetical protein
MFRDSMTGNPALAIFDAMLMTFASLLALAEAGARIGHVPAWGARQRHPFPQADDAPAAPGRRREVVHRPRYAHRSARPRDAFRAAGQPASASLRGRVAILLNGIRLLPM